MREEVPVERTELEQMTAPNLRKLALEGYPEITSVSGMKIVGNVCTWR